MGEGTESNFFIPARCALRICLGELCDEFRGAEL